MVHVVYTMDIVAGVHLQARPEILVYLYVTYIEEVVGEFSEFTMFYCRNIIEIKIQEKNSKKVYELYIESDL